MRKYQIMIAVGGPKLYELWTEYEGRFTHLGYFDTRAEADEEIQRRTYGDTEAHA